MNSRYADPWGNGVSATRVRNNGETRKSGVGGIRLDQVVVAGSNILKKSSKHIRLLYENFNSINIPGKTRRLNTLHLVQLSS